MLGIQTVTVKRRMESIAFQKFCTLASKFQNKKLSTEQMDIIIRKKYMEQ
jgi:hypothetical protein